MPAEQGRVFCREGVHVSGEREKDIQPASANRHEIFVCAPRGISNSNFADGALSPEPRGLPRVADKALPESLSRPPTGLPPHLLSRSFSLSVEYATSYFHIYTLVHVQFRKMSLLYFPSQLFSKHNILLKAFGIPQRRPIHFTYRRPVDDLAPTHPVQHQSGRHAHIICV